MGEKNTPQQSKIVIDLADENAWDDTLLIKAYDESLLLAREEVAKQLASETNILYKVNQTPTKSAADLKKYKVGDFVRATYNDGIDYEAKIIEILDDTEACLLKYVGYDNEEFVKMCNLIPSWGQKARREQQKKSQKNAQSSESDGDAGRPSNTRTNTKPKEFGHDIPMNVPPPPPLPPFLENTEESEHLSAMLMSWYMSGYYTGYYQGIKQGAHNTK